MRDLNGVRVLAVEDEPLVAMLLEDMLAELGCVAEACIASLPMALEAAKTGTFDVALLDVNVAGQRIFPVAEVLRGRGIPFAFATGYGESGLPEGLRDCPVISKPYTEQHLAQALRNALDGAGPKLTNPTPISSAR